MLFRRQHLRDHELILAAGGELPARRQASAQRHLAQCGGCDDRLRRLERAVTAMSDGLTPSREMLPAASMARVRLQARLREHAGRGPEVDGPGFSRYAFACFAILCATATIGWFLAADRTAPELVEQSHVVLMRPLPALTPGMVRTTVTADVCGADRPVRLQPVSPTVHARVFESYGADVRRAEEYELDYLITPELGGAADVRNLWPQPYGRTTWNALVKDELELHFHRLVCDGTLDLTTAQQEMATDWIAAYKRYFGTDRPRRDYITSPLTALDEEMLRAEMEERGLTTPAMQSGHMMLAALQDPGGRDAAWLQHRTSVSRWRHSSE